MTEAGSLSPQKGAHVSYQQANMPVVLVVTLLQGGSYMRISILRRMTQYVSHLSKALDASRCWRLLSWPSVTITKGPWFGAIPQRKKLKWCVPEKVSYASHRGKERSIHATFQLVDS